jgi:hypothetical protein
MLLRYQSLSIKISHLKSPTTEVPSLAQGMLLNLLPGCNCALEY